MPAGSWIGFRSLVWTHPRRSYQRRARVSSSRTRSVAAENLRLIRSVRAASCIAVTVSALCVGHQALHLLFGTAPTYTYPEALPAVGDVGETVTIDAVFDGWGYVTLYDAWSGEALDHYAIPEAHDPEKAFGFGDLSVHEVATHPEDESLAYLSYYGGGLRNVQIQCDGQPYDSTNPPTDVTSCVLVEVGGYLDELGNNVWGAEVLVGDDGMTYVLAGDRDGGLWIFRHP